MTNLYELRNSNGTKTQNYMILCTIILISKGIEVKKNFISQLIFKNLQKNRNHQKITELLLLAISIPYSPY